MQILSFIKHFLTAKRGGHGIHSPFVYQLVTKVLYDKRKHQAYQLPETILNNMYNNPKIIEHIDFGAGKKPKHNIRIDQIAKKSVIKPKWGRLLHRMVKYVQPFVSLELGTSLGIGSLYIASALNEEGILYTFEGSPQIAATAESNFEISGLHNQIHTITGKIDEQLPNVLSKLELVDFVYIDANHQFSPTIKYFHWLLEKSNEHSVFIFDDIHWSADMSKAWKEIQQHPKVTVTIDLYRFGLVFFKKDQAKENFKVWI